MNRNHLTSVTGLAVFAIATITPTAAKADLVVLDSIAHGTLYETNGSPLANGLGNAFFAGSNGQGFSRRGLIRFDLAALGPDVVVESVTLRLHASQSNVASSQVNLHRVLADWGVGSTDAPGNEGGGGPATPGSATWDESFFGETPWDTAGGDFDASASAAADVAGVGWYEWSSEGLIADVQAMIEGGFGNFGWILVGDETAASTAKRFDSMFAGPEFRPELEIEFSVVPAPGAIVAFGLVGLGGGRARRRR